MWPLVGRKIQAFSASAVSLNGQELAMRSGESKQEHVLEVDGYKSSSLVWASHQNALGNTVEVTTGAAAQSAVLHPSQRADCNINSSL